MTGVHEVPTQLLEVAADWFLRVRSRKADSELHVAWLHWIEADPAHREAFEAVQATWDAVGQVEPPPWPRPEELAGLAFGQPEQTIEPDRTIEEGRADLSSPAPAVDAPGDVLNDAPNDLPNDPPPNDPLESPPPASRSLPSRKTLRRPHASRRRFGPVPSWALAAGLATCVIALLAVRFDPATAWLAGGAQQRIATARGEQQSAVLSDGSRIELGGLTGVEVQFSPERRLVIADEGEVFYRVEHDPARPFVVEAGPVSVKAIGTAFSVRREAGTVSVVVTEGIVEVNAMSESGTAGTEPVLRVKAGERIRFDRGHLQAVPQAVHTGHDVVWRRGRLRFEEEPLRVVVASLNRYTSKQIVLGDPSLQELRFTGTVFDDSVEDWLVGVQVVFRVSVDESHPDRIVIQARK